MALGKAFCVLCGNEGELTSERLCTPCFKDRTTLSILPETIQGFRCPKCMMYLHEKRWGHHPDEEYEEGLVFSNVLYTEYLRKQQLRTHLNTISPTIVILTNSNTTADI